MEFSKNQLMRLGDEERRASDYNNIRTKISFLGHLLKRLKQDGQEEGLWEFLTPHNYKLVMGAVKELREGIRKWAWPFHTTLKTFVISNEGWP